MRRDSIGPALKGNQLGCGGSCATLSFLRSSRFYFRTGNEFVSNGDNLPANDHPEQSDEGHYWRCWRADANHTVYDPGEYASKQRKNIGFHSLFPADLIHG